MPISQGRRPDGLPSDIALGNQNDQFLSELHGRYYSQASKGNLFMAQAIVTAPVIFTTAAGTGGPLLWNPPGSGVNGVLLAAGFGVTVVTTAAAALGLAWTTTSTVLPTATTAIDTSGNLKIGGPAAKIQSFRLGTVATAASVFLPFAHLHTGALTVDTTGVQWVDLGGSVIVPAGFYVSVSASATATLAVIQSALIWEEVPESSFF